MISKRPLDDKRKIIFLVDPIGNNGKSVFFQLLSSLPTGAINKYLSSSLNTGADSSSSTSIHNAVSYHTNSPTTTKMMTIKEEDDPKNNKPDSDGESKISGPADILKEEYLSEPGGPSAADDECILDSESDAHNQNLSHEEILLKLKKEESDISRMEDRCSITDNEGNDKDPYSRREHTTLGALTNNISEGSTLVNIEFQYLTVEGNKANDILYLVDCSQANCNTTQSIFLVDLARCEAQHLNYALLEKLKNGVWMSTKYEGKKASYKNGQVIVAMNELPDVTKLSQDRYEIYLLHDKKFAFGGKPIPVARIPATRKLHAKFLQQLLTLSL
jgi:hypothetical protein